MSARRVAVAGLVIAAVAAAVVISLSRSDSGTEPAAQADPEAPHPATTQARVRPPVVMIAFDEFPTISLLDASGHIDAVRYPNFARLAADANWYPYATAPVDETGRAMETMLTGNEPERKRPVTLAKNPRNLFTFLGHRGYRMHVSEEVSNLCPRRLCPSSRPQNRASIRHELAGGRPERFEAWERSIRRSSHPTLYFKHTLLPHVPEHYLPSGRHYSYHPRELLAGLSSAFNSRWPVTQAYQRHLLQLGFTDRLLGKALDRLRKDGLYDRSLIVVTADNGESFGRYGNRHEISRRNAIDIALTPLVIKTPHQRTGRIVRRHVRTLDIVPTIAHVTRLRLPWRTGGVSLLGRSVGRIPGGVSMVQRSGHHIHLSYHDLVQQARSALRAKLKLFGSRNTGPGLYGIGPDPELHGKQAASLPAVAGAGLSARVNERATWRSVRLGSSYLPSLITGRLTGERARGSHELAFAVNGTIAATGPAFALPGARGKNLFSALVPETAFREGANDIAIYEVTRGAQGPRLSRIPG